MTFLINKFTKFSFLPHSAPVILLIKLISFSSMCRFYWKIVNNGDGRAVAFIGLNYAGAVTNTDLKVIQVPISSTLEEQLFHGNMFFEAYLSCNIFLRKKVCNRLSLKC